MTLPTQGALRGPSSWPRPAQAIFAVSLLAWMGGFALISRWGTWSPLAVLAPLLAVLALGTSPAARALLTPRRSLVGLGVFFGVVMIASTYTGFALAVRVYPPIMDLSRDLYQLLAAPRFSTLQVALLIPLIASSEELVFRGAALEGPLPEAFPRAVLLSWPSARSFRRLAFQSALVGLAHLASGSPLLALIACACGFVWGLLRLATGSLVPTLLVHVLWNLAILVFYPLV